MFAKVNIATALIVAANAGAFTAEHAASFNGRQLRRGMKKDAEPFTAADIPKIQPLFSVFDTNNDSIVEPKEIWTAHKAMTGDEEGKKAFMMRMDSGMRTYCGVPQKKQAMPVSRRGRRGRDNKRGGRGKKDWKKKMQKMKRKAKKLMGMMATKKMFMQFSRADADFDMKVTPIEMGTFMNQQKRKMCKKYMKEQAKNRAMAWMKAGVPAEVQAEMEAKKAEMKKKWGDKKAAMMKRWDEMKDKWNSKRRGGRNNRGGRRGRD